MPTKQEIAAVREAMAKDKTRALSKGIPESIVDGCDEALLDMWMKDLIELRISETGENGWIEAKLKMLGEYTSPKLGCPKCGELKWELLEFQGETNIIKCLSCGSLFDADNWADEKVN